MQKRVCKKEITDIIDSSIALHKGNKCYCSDKASNTGFVCTSCLDLKKIKEAVEAIQNHCSHQPVAAVPNPYGIDYACSVCNHTIRREDV